MKPLKLSSNSNAPKEAADALLAAEAKRHSVLINDDTETFKGMISDDIVHVHTTGNINNKSELIHHTGTFLKFKNIERGELTIRSLSSDIAVMTGQMTNTVGKRGTDEEIQVRSFVTQVWQKTEEEWKIVSFQATRRNCQRKVSFNRPALAWIHDQEPISLLQDIA